MKSVYPFLFLVALSSLPSWGAETTAYTTVVSVYSFTQYGGGDVAVEVVAPAPTCSSGYWLKASDPGFKATFATLLSAYHSGNRVRIGGADTDIWPGSTGLHCRISYVAVIPS